MSATFSNVQLISNDGSQLPWNIGSDTLIVWDVANNLNATLETSDALLVHPNPVRSVLTVDLASLDEPSSLRFYDLEGRLLFETTSLDQASKAIDMSRFAPGLYFLKVKTMHGQTHQCKVLKLD